MVATAQPGALERMMNLHRPGDLSPDVARAILSWRFAETDQARVSELSELARSGTLSTEQSRELDWYMMLGDFLTIIQSQARTSLKTAPAHS